MRSAVEVRVRPVELTTLTSARERGVAAGVFYLAGSAVAYLAVADPVVARGPMLAIAAAATLVGAASIRWADRFTVAVTHAVVALASTLIALAVVVGGGGHGSVLVLVDAALVAAFVGLLGSARARAAQVGWMAVALAAAAALLWPVAIAGATVAAVLVVSATTTVVAGAVARRLRESATTDAMTGLANRAGFDAVLAAAVQTAERDGRRLGLVLLDLDGFKQVNDRRGHAAGDELLREAARRWRRALPTEATLARVGGDEFAVVLPDTPPAQGAEVAAQLAGMTPQVGCSVGVASWTWGMDAGALVAAADRRLYAAKADRAVDAPGSMARA